MQNYRSPTQLIVYMANIIQNEEGMVYMLLYAHLCHYTGCDFGETFS